MNSRLEKALSELQNILKLTYRNKLHKIMLYGSQARGDAEKESDIDVLVILNGHVHPGKEIARMSQYTSEISLKYDVVLSCFYLSRERYLSENTPLVINMRREGVAL